jgi:hypothetical protein
MSSSRSGGRAGWKANAGIYLLFLAVYLAGASGHFYSTDHVGLYTTTQSIVDDRDLSVDPAHTQITVKGRNGASFSPYGIGQALVATPFYLAGRTVDNVSAPRVRRYFEGYTVGSTSAVLWGGTVPIFFVSLFTQFVAPLVCVLVFMFLLELGFSRATSFFTTLVFGFGTAIATAGHEFTQHSLETLLLLGTIYVLFRNRADLRTRHALLAGALLGFGLLTRINLVVVAPAIGVYLVAMMRTAQPLLARRSGVGGLLAWSGLRPIDRRLLRVVGAFLLPLALASGFILFLNYLRWENAFNFGVATGATASGAAAGAAVPNTHFSFGHMLVGLYGFLLSPGRSIFLYSPPALLGLFAFRRFYEVRRAEALLFATVGCTYLLFYASQDLWYGGFAWGPRYLLPVVPLLVIPSAYLLETRRAALVAVALGVAGLGVNILGTVENVSYVIYAHRTIGAEPWDLQKTYLFVPGQSPVATHLQDLLGNRHVDLWLVYVWEQFGTGVVLLTLAVPALLLAAAILLLRDVARPPDGRVTEPASGGVERLAGMARIPRTLWGWRWPWPFGAGTEALTALERRAVPVFLGLLVVITVMFNAVALFPEVRDAAPSNNDDAFQFLMIQRGSQALANGENPLDHWSPELDIGAPRFLSYQNAPHLAVIFLDRLLLRTVGLLTLFNLTRYLLLVGLPFTVYWSMRRMEFPVVAAAFGAAVAPLLSANHLFGFEYDSYVWRGYGMYTQLWGMHLSFIALACLYRLVNKGTGYAAAVVACSLLVLSHLLFAEMMILTAGIVFLVGLNRTNLRARVIRSGIVGGLTMLITAFFWVPFLRSQPYLGVSPYEAGFHFDSYGAPTVMRWLVHGKLLDFDRLPVFTAMLAIGILSVLVSRTRQGLLAVSRQASATIATTPPHKALRYSKSKTGCVPAGRLVQRGWVGVFQHHALATACGQAAKELLSRCSKKIMSRRRTDRYA